LLVDPDYSVWNQYGMGYIPHNVVLDRSMVVRYTDYGYDEHQIISIIESYTAIENNELAPSSFSLSQNYPNPFNPRTIINYELPITSFVDLGIYNMLGQKVVTLVSEKQSAGYHEVEFNGQILSSGIYLYRIEAGEFQDVKKMMLLK
jgi:hypothetical protein